MQGLARLEERLKALGIKLTIEDEGSNITHGRTNPAGQQ
mgnify:FL=1